MLALLNHRICNSLVLAQAEAARIDLNNIESRHISIAITGMLIVFTALLLVSIAIAILPKVLDLLSGILPAEKLPASNATQAVQKTSDQDEVFAAIGMALHLQKQGQV